MPWLVWIVVGFILIGFELFLPSGFALLVIGISFLITGLCTAYGLTEPSWLPWFICLTSSVVLFLSLRKPLQEIFGVSKPSNYNDHENAEVIINSVIAPGGIGQGEMQGTQWSVRNIGSTSLHTGDRCKVISVNGLTVETKK